MVINRFFNGFNISITINEFYIIFYGVFCIVINEIYIVDEKQKAILPLLDLGGRGKGGGGE